MSEETKPGLGSSRWAVPNASKKPLKPSKSGVGLSKWDPAYSPKEAEDYSNPAAEALKGKPINASKTPLKPSKSGVGLSKWDPANFPKDEEDSSGPAAQVLKGNPINAPKTPLKLSKSGIGLSKWDPANSLKEAEDSSKPAAQAFKGDSIDASKTPLDSTKLSVGASKGDSSKPSAGASKSDLFNSSKETLQFSKLGVGASKGNSDSFTKHPSAQLSEFTTAPKADPANSPIQSPININKNPDLSQSFRGLSLVLPPKDAKIPSTSKVFNMNWDFRLPVLDQPSVVLRDSPSNIPLQLASVMEHGADPEDIRQLLLIVPDQARKLSINNLVSGYPLIFYAARTNNEDIIRNVVAYGADVNAFSDHHKVPVLAYVIIACSMSGYDCTSTLKTLLSLGASADVFPKLFYSPYDTVLPYDGPSEDELADLDEENKKWCQPADIRSKLALGLDITQRYYLKKATTIPRSNERRAQFAGGIRISALLALPYLLIGQTVAAISCKESLLRHFLFTSGNKQQQPLILVFAGPNGHGKTELACRFSALLSTKMTNVDCSIFSNSDQLFGSQGGHKNSENGSNLNNFIAEHDGKRCVVFLDKFEKTTYNVHDALLKPFSEGEYQDRRTNKRIDTSQFIWILATNALDPVIMKFHDEHASVMSNENEKDEPVRTQLVSSLSQQLRSAFTSSLKSPLTCHISQFIPFLPFTAGEQAVCFEKILLELKRRIHEPVNLGDKRLCGDVVLHIHSGPAICKHLADLWYDRNTGINSLMTAVNTEIRNLIGSKYLDEFGTIRDGQPQVVYHLDLRKGNTLVLTKDGERVEDILDDEI
ncbi:hypothetical protein EG328_002222 [Venturia inaequalis]|uniref:ATPase AAA-type core domain-containing protein n=1 Tax=Venturia inaequalis TaxID=5025 RepID=A0A8H3ZCS3_VENIN|nr:hypothetical protein EG328_002222 [Venturia inaequalis]